MSLQVSDSHLTRPVATPNEACSNAERGIREVGLGDSISLQLVVLV